MMIVS